MFANAIETFIHPATWAVCCVTRLLLGNEYRHRGTGFAIDGQGHILTCWHCLFEDEACTIPCEEMVVFQPEIDPQRQLTAKIIAAEKDSDLAILKIEASTRPVTLVSGRRIPYGTSCGLFGHPLSEIHNNIINVYTRAAAGVVSTHFVRNIFHDTVPVGIYELDLFAHGGNSGGPVFLRSGYVFGVLESSRLFATKTGQFYPGNLNFATDISEAIQLAESVNVRPKLHRIS